MSRGWMILKLLRNCKRCGARSVRIFADAQTNERRCTQCITVEDLPSPTPSHGEE